MSPSRAPPSQIYLWNTFRRSANAFAFLVTNPYLRLYVAFTICIQDQPVNNMIIKRNLKINALSLYLLYELGSVVHVLFVYYWKSEPVRIRFEIVGGLISLYLGLTYMKYIYERII